jgi:hypothetical protein
MCGGGLAYRVAVPVDQAPIAAKKSGYQMNMEIDGHRANFLTLCHAITPAAHFDMLTGLERWEQFKIYDKQAQALELDLAERAFPEVATIRARGRKNLDLWHNGLIVPEPAGHTNVWIDADITPNPKG